MGLNLGPQRMDTARRNEWVAAATPEPDDDLIPFGFTDSRPIRTVYMHNGLE